ncbi:hypothetical protein Aduo_017993 [Ancylostoma duodenale]
MVPVVDILLLKIGQLLKFLTLLRVISRGLPQYLVVKIVFQQRFEPEYRPVFLVFSMNIAVTMRQSQSTIRINHTVLNPQCAIARHKFQRHTS